MIKNFNDYFEEDKDIPVHFYFAKEKFEEYLADAEHMDDWMMSPSEEMSKDDWALLMLYVFHEDLKNKLLN